MSLSKDEFSAERIRGADIGYVAFHAPRFAYLLKTLDQLGLTPKSRVLDVGRSALTDLIRDRFQVSVDTLGFEEDQTGPRGNHYGFDLNQTQQAASWRRELPQYDFIIFAEVIEHLHTAPELVLEFIKSLLAPGGTLVIQTPNAAAATRRIKLLFGRNPYERIRLDPTNPGHFREYTVRELRGLAANAGLTVIFCDVRYYFDARFARHGATPEPQPVIGTLKNLVFPLLPSSMRLGITMALKRS
jgi:SAM-dependent methyltransferase